MSLYLDSSALLKRYVLEPDGDRYEEILRSDPDWVTARHTSVEVRRNLSRRLSEPVLSDKRRDFERDWQRCHVVELDEATCDLAAQMAEATGARTFDALHLAAAQQAGAGALPLATSDERLARIARSLGWTVLGT